MAGTPSLIVHGGAGRMDPETHQAHIDGVRQAAEIGWQILQTGGSALDAVEQAVRYLEDNPSFNAGRGSALTSEGTVEMDAFIMDGTSLDSGAVTCVRTVQNPVSLARLVMAHSTHALLAGEGAEQFAQHMGIPQIPQDYLRTEREIARWQAWKAQQAEANPGHDTVGAVARDSQGNIAAATSTGGIRNQLPGRVGDTPLVGCGTYADNLTGGASATGIGEMIMKLVMCKTVCDLIGSGLNAQAAADEALRRFAGPRIHGSGGVIVIDPQGRIGLAYNTPQMARAYVQPDGTIVAAV